MSSFPKFHFDNNKNSSSKSELLQRVGAFLPQIEAANQALLQQGDDEVPKIDATLTKDDDDDDDDENEQDDDDQDASNSHDENDDGDNVPRVPTIQLKVAIGKVDENPVISLLASDDDDDDDDDEEKNDSDDEKDDEEALEEEEGELESNQREIPLLEIAHSSTGKKEGSVTKKRKLISDMLRVAPSTTTTLKKPLIEEL